MSEISLEKVDIIRERTGVSYAQAKEALEACDGNVVDALVYIEQNSKTHKEEMYTSIQDFKSWLKDLIDKGNVNRIRIKKDDKVIVDVPVNAGVTMGALSLIWPPLIALIGIGTIAAVFTKFTIEITKTDGSVEVVNKIIKNTAETVKDKVSNFASEVGDKFNKTDKTKNSNTENVYQYTVKFDDDKDDFQNKDDNSQDNKDSSQSNDDNSQDNKNNPQQ